MDWKSGFEVSWAYRIEENIFDFRGAAGYISIVLFIAALKLWVRGKIWIAWLAFAQKVALIVIYK